MKTGAENYPSKNVGRVTNLDPSKMYFPLGDATFVSFCYAKHSCEKHTCCLLHMQLHTPLWIDPLLTGTIYLKRWYRLPTVKSIFSKRGLEKWKPVRGS